MVEEKAIVLNVADVSGSALCHPDARRMYLTADRTSDTAKRVIAGMVLRGDAKAPDRRRVPRKSNSG